MVNMDKIDFLSLYTLRNLQKNFAVKSQDTLLDSVSATAQGCVSQKHWVLIVEQLPPMVSTINLYNANNAFGKCSPGQQET